MPATYHFGPKILFDGYLTDSKFLCDGDVMETATRTYKLLKFNTFLCDGCVTGSKVLFDGYLIKEKK